MFLLVDKEDGDVLTSYDFFNVVKKVRQEFEEEQAFKRVYMCMDKDGDQLLTLREIKKAFMANAFEIASLLEPFPELRPGSHLAVGSSHE